MHGPVGRRRTPQQLGAATGAGFTKACCLDTRRAVAVAEGLMRLPWKQSERDDDGYDRTFQSRGRIDTPRKGDEAAAVVCGCCEPVPLR